MVRGFVMGGVVVVGGVNRCFLGAARQPLSAKFVYEGAFADLFGFFEPVGGVGGVAFVGCGFGRCCWLVVLRMDDWHGWFGCWGGSIAQIKYAAGFDAPVQGACVGGGGVGWRVRRDDGFRWSGACSGREIER